MVILKGRTGKTKTRRHTTGQMGDGKLDTDLERANRILALGDMDSMLRSLDDELCKNPDSVVMLDVKIQLLLPLGKFKEAEDICQKALARNKNSVEMYERMADIIFTSGRTADALPYDDMAIQLCKRMGADKHVLARVYNNKGSRLLDMGKDGDALDCFEMSIMVDPYYAAAYISKGIVLYNMGDHKGSEACLSTAKRLERNMG